MPPKEPSTSNKERLIRDAGVRVGLCAHVGATDGRLTLPAEPVWDGLTAARGRQYLTTTDGKLRCFGP